MKTVLKFTLVIFALFVMVSCEEDSPVSSTPKENTKKENTKAVNLSGTTWNGIDNVKGKTTIFNRDNTVTGTFYTTNAAPPEKVTYTSTEITEYYSGVGIKKSITLSNDTLTLAMTGSKGNDQGTTKWIKKR